MKNMLSCFVLLFVSMQIFAQNKSDYFKFLPSYVEQNTPEWAKLMYSDDPNVFEVDFEYNKYFAEKTFEKDLHTQNYKFWRRHIRAIVNENGFIRPLSYKDQKALEQIWKDKKTQQRTNGNWISIGPFETYAQGTTMPISQQANVYSIDVANGNPNKLLAGSESGGVFVSNDKGLNWSLISADEVFSNSITAVKIHPSNHNTYFVSANERIYKTTDNGNTWTEEAFVNGAIYEFLFNPNNFNIIWAVGSQGLRKSINGGSTWSIIYAEASWDIAYHPTIASIMYLLKSNSSLNKSELFRSSDSGTTWTNITNGWYVPEVPSEAQEGGGKIAVSADDPNRVYVALIGSSKANDNGWIGLYRSDDQGQSWYLPSGQIGGPYNSPNTMPWNAAAYSDGYHQGFYNFDLEASQTDADKVWMGSIRLTESNDGGLTYLGIGAANSTRLSNIHADIQDIEVIGSDVWVASDGGINYSADELITHDSRKKGIIGSDFWGFGAGWNDDVLVGGKYHNGNSAYYQTYGSGNYHDVGGVEEPTGYVNPLFNLKAYFNKWWAGVTETLEISTSLGGSVSYHPNLSLIPNESYITCSSSGIYFDPRYADHLYLGNDSKIYKSEDAGSTLNILHDFGSPGTVMEMAIGYNDPETIYAVYQPGGGYWDWCEIHKTIDGGASWTKLTDISANRWRLDITVNPLDASEIWVTTPDGANGEKVFQSINGGTSWINRSSPVINDIGPRDILYQGGSDNVYLASRTGIYLFDKNTGVWTDYSSGLPLISNSLEMHAFYRDNKLRLATYGRGIWETSLASPSNLKAKIITEKDSIFCSKDTIQFDSHSIVDQSNVTWNWAITPAPSYIENTSIRNPKVVFGNAGSYDVSLSVTTPSGSDTETIVDMVHVLNGCDPDTIPGKSLEVLAGGADYVQLPNLNMPNTDELTISAWVKLNGIQADYASVLMNDGDAAGLNFREGNNTLGYHWPGGQWYWDSNLEVPIDEWTHVAMTVQAGSVTIYLDGVPSVHNINVSAVDINTMKIGSYKGWGDRNMNGEIDEVVLWDRALTTHEIRLHRHLTKEDLLANNDDIVAYYQFNGNQSEVLDRASTFHGAISGGASKIESSAPVGGGTSAFHLVSQNNYYNFGDTGLELDFTAVSTLANGPIYASRINLLPYNSPPDLESTNCYWILNNYGNQNADSPYLSILNSPYSNPSIASLDNGNSIRLKSRDENEHLDNWSFGCALGSVFSGSSGSYFFDLPGCQSGFNDQLFVFRDNCTNILNIATDYSNNENESVIASNRINATNSVNPTSDIYFQAGNLIDLKIGFEVNVGSIFEAVIDNCNN